MAAGHTMSRRVAPSFYAVRCSQYDRAMHRCLPPDQRIATVDVAPVDNSARELDLLPDEEALVRLYELVERFGRQDPAHLRPKSESERHRASHGHLLRFGCCATPAEAEAEADRRAA
jgi:hypothetical protein